MERLYDIIVVGAGPAGLTAAIYAGRAGLDTLILEAGAPGGKLVKTNEIENWPGIQKTGGVDLAMSMYEHATSVGAVHAYGNVSKVEDLGATKKVTCEDGTVYESKVVIVATGTVERLMNIPGEEQNIGRGISFCAVCDGAFFRDKVVTVIGGGNSALEEADYVTQFASEVNIVIRRDVFRADPAAQKVVENNPKIKIIRKHIPIEVIDDGRMVTGLVIEDVETKERTTIPTSGLFPYIGADPATEFLEGLGVLNERKFIDVDVNFETKVKGIYGIGDVIDKPLRQVVTATGDGAVAAQHAFHAIREAE